VKRPIDFTGHGEAERLIVHVLWLTSGLSCDGESVSLTAATNPSLEELLRGAIPGQPRIALYNPLLAFDVGDDYLRAWHAAARGELDPFVLVVEGSIANEDINGEGHWSGFGVDDEGQPITASTWIDRLAPRAAAVMALGTCAAYGGVPAMRNNPTGAMGLRDHLGHRFVSRNGVRLVNLPGCPVQADAITETLQRIALEIAGVAPRTELDDQGRPLWLFEQTAHETCDRAGLAEHGHFAETLADHGSCLAKLGCAGPVARCNVPARGWVNGVGGCPNVGGICIACTMPGFPDRFLPFMDSGPFTHLSTSGGRFLYGPVLRRLRERSMRSVTRAAVQ
jgi:hydrogenase small subunit